MTHARANTRSIRIRTINILKDGEDVRNYDWQTAGFLAFEAYDGFDGWHGRLPRKEFRKSWPRDGEQTDLSLFDELIGMLHSVPRERIYPLFPVHNLTSWQGGGDSTTYFKAPDLIHFHDDSTDETAVRFLEEARIHEKILCNPHPNLGSYLGCVVDKGRLVRLAFKKYGNCSLETLTRSQRVECITQVEAAAAHLHSIGLAHNDISPSNIMFDDTGRAILIDLDACAPLGSPIKKGGWVTGWKGPIDGEGRQFYESSAECDKLAIQEIRRYLLGDMEWC